MSWVCAQIGQREHYAIARMLARQGKLDTLVTDFWKRGCLAHLAARAAPKLAQRWHPDLSQAKVVHGNTARLTAELVGRIQKKDAWEQTMARNAWFEDVTIRALKASREAPQILFAYSYAARNSFAYAKDRGMKTVLGQIDPARYEVDWVQEKTASYQQLCPPQSYPPEHYWKRWHEECELADRIVVNSEWSAQALLAQGIPPSKLTVIPLAYERGFGRVTAREPITSFTSDRPLVLLFLGQILLRKGAGELFTAMEALKDRPVVFEMVGPLLVKVPDAVRQLPSVRFHGYAHHDRVREHLSRSDVMLLPTHSDGFAITQLEALASGLPLLVSRNCAHVIEAGVSGHFLDEVTPQALIAAIEHFLANPAYVTQLQAGARLPADYSLEAVGQHYAQLEQGLNLS